MTVLNTDMVDIPQQIVKFIKSDSFVEELTRFCMETRKLDLLKNSQYTPRWIKLFLNLETGILSSTPWENEQGVFIGTFVFKNLRTAVTQGTVSNFVSKLRQKLVSNKSLLIYQARFGTTYANPFLSTDYLTSFRRYELMFILMYSAKCKIDKQLDNIQNWSTFVSNVARQYYDDDFALASVNISKAFGVIKNGFIAKQMLNKEALRMYNELDKFME